MQEAIANLMPRLWDFVMPEPNSGCWLWVRACDWDGYGIFKVSGSKRNYKPHRLLYCAHFGAIPEGALVCHRCDVPACVNPDHLFLGSQKDNMADRSRKGRHLVGIKSPRAVLTESDVLNIRSSPLSLNALAAQYGVTDGNIWHIKHRKSWSHLP